jgi:hypothetical protein
VSAGADREEIEMTRVLVQYKVKPDRATENEELVRAVYAELQEKQPPGLRYSTLKLDDGVSFVHLAEHDEGRPNQLTQLAAFKRFQEGLEERCDEPPVLKTLTAVGSYRLFNDDSPGG